MCVFDDWNRLVDILFITSHTVAVHCSVLQRAAVSCTPHVRCSVLQRAAACCSMLQRVAACCSVLQCPALHVCVAHDWDGLVDLLCTNFTQCCSAWQCGAAWLACCSVLQCVVVLQYVAVCCDVLHWRIYSHSQKNEKEKRNQLTLKCAIGNHYKADVWENAIFHKNLKIS